MVQLKCPDASRWQALLADSASSDSAELESHLAGCSRCQHLLDDLAIGSSGWLRDANRLAKSTDADGEMTRTLHRLRDGLLDEHYEPPVALDFLKPSDQPGVLGTLGRYQVLEVLGRGAFGIVLKALDPDLLRPVAIKVLAPYLAPSGTARARFLREARAAAAVSHDHIVTIHAVETGESVPYIVMEYVTGISLQQRLDRDGPLSPTEIARIGLQTANGLAAAHEQGRVHRDIKPANILLENGVERVKITDFGLARAADDARLTQSGVAAGTPLYMSPEQARGEAVDHRSDLFSLGSVLYTLATGFPPFRADSTMGVLNRITNNSPRPIRETIPDFPAELEKVIMQLLEKDPGKRFQLAADVSFKLTGYLSGTPSEPEPPAPVSTDAEPNQHKRAMGRATALWLLFAAGLVVVVLTFRTSKGTLIVEVDDPDIKVALNGEGDELLITGAGPQEVRVKPGTYHVSATKDGKPVKVSPEIVTITRNGKKVVSVSFQPEPVAGDPNFDALLDARLKAAFPVGDAERIDVMKLAWKTGKAKIPISHPAGAKPIAQTHQSFPKLQKLMVEAEKSNIEVDRLEIVLSEAYALAGTILADTAKSAALMADRKNPTADPTWAARLDELKDKFDSLVRRLADTSAGSLVLTPGPINDLDKAVAGVKEADREKVKKLLATRDRFALLLPKANAAAIQLNRLKDLVANSARTNVTNELEAMYSSLSTDLREMEKLAKDLGAKAPLPVAFDFGNPARDWEGGQKKMARDFDALIREIAKSRTGSVLLTAGPMADPDKVTAGMMTRDANRVKRLLAIRDQFGLLIPQAQKALDRWEKAQLDVKNKVEPHKAGIITTGEWEAAKLELKQAERALVTAEDSIATLLADLDKIAKEFGVTLAPGGDPFEGELKRMMVEYESLKLRLAKTTVGRLLATIPEDGGWSMPAVKSTVGPDERMQKQGERLLTLRGQITTQVAKAEAAVSERAARMKSKAESKKENPVPNIDEAIGKSEQEARFRIAAVRGLVEDLAKLADEIEDPDKK